MLQDQICFMHHILLAETAPLKYLGCYIDNKRQRDLDGPQQSNKKHNKISTCVKRCLRAGNAYTIYKQVVYTLYTSR